MRIVVRWTRRVNHKSVFHNTNQFHKIKISLPKHKSISQHISQFTKTQTEQFLKTKTNFPKYKSVYQYTNQFSKTQTNFQNTNQLLKTQTNFAKYKAKDSALALYLSESLEGTHSQDFPPPTWRLLLCFRLQKMFCHNCGSEVLQEYLYCSQCGTQLDIDVPSDGEGSNRGLL